MKFNLRLPLPAHEIPFLVPIKHLLVLLLCSALIVHVNVSADTTKAANARSQTNSNSQNLQSDIAHLLAKPERCVALHKGQTCYQKINFNWSVDISGDYCLVEYTSNDIIECWKNSKQGSLKYDMQSTTDLLFYLIEEKTRERIASVKLTVAWVYKKNRQRQTTWRLF